MAMSELARAIPWRKTAPAHPGCYWVRGKGVQIAIAEFDQTTSGDLAGYVSFGGVGQRVSVRRWPEGWQCAQVAIEPRCCRGPGRARPHSRLMAQRRCLVESPFGMIRRGSRKAKQRQGR